MIPKKHKDILPEVCKELDYSFETIEAVVDFYWRKIRKEMEQQQQYRIHITKLGDFHISRKKLMYMCFKYAALEKKYSIHTYKNYNKAKHIQDKHNNFKRLLLEVEEERKRRYMLYRERYEKNS